MFSCFSRIGVGRAGEHGLRQMGAADRLAGGAARVELALRRARSPSSLSAAAMRRVRCSRSARNSVSRLLKQRAGVVDAVAEDVQFAGRPGAAGAVINGGDLDGGHDAHAAALTGGDRLGDAASTVSWSDSASSSTPACGGALDHLGRRERAVGVGGVRLQVEGGGTRGTRMRSAQPLARCVRAGSLAGDRPAATSTVRSRWLRRPAHGGVVAAGLFERQGSPAGGVDRVELGAARPRSRRRAGMPRSTGPPGRPWRRAELLLGEESRCSSSRSTGSTSWCSQLLLGVGAQQQADVGEVGGRVGGWSCGASVLDGRDQRSDVCLASAAGRALENGLSLHASVDARHAGGRRSRRGDRSADEE